MELEIGRKKGELTQLEARKREWETSGLKGPVVSLSVSRQHSQDASAEPDTPKMKINGKKSPRNTIACPHKRERSPISHT